MKRRGASRPLSFAFALYDMICVRMNMGLDHLFLEWDVFYAHSKVPGKKPFSDHMHTRMQTLWNWTIQLACARGIFELSEAANISNDNKLKKIIHRLVVWNIIFNFLFRPEPNRRPIEDFEVKIPTRFWESNLQHCQWMMWTTMTFCQRDHRFIRLTKSQSKVERT